jgi:hypothetical protein
MVASIPRLDRPVLVVFALCLAAACVGHINDLWQHGWLPYRFAPLPLNIYWTALTLLDGLGAVLLLVWPRIGLALALLIISSDVALNLFARFYLRIQLNAVALSLQIVFFIAILAATVYARRMGAATQTI